jgi:hypothetical protein
MWNWLRSFFKRRKVRTELKVIEAVEDDTGIGKAIDLLDQLDLSRYTIREALGHRVMTYSTDVAQLLEWVSGMHLVVTEGHYVPDKWKTMSRSANSKILDDYLSEDRHDVHPRVFVAQARNKLMQVHTKLGEMTSEEDLFQKRYYQRQYRAVIDDCLELIKVLGRLTSK